jgi:SsrA-binding protein
MKKMPDLAENRKARFDYEILETLEAGVELLGHEVKSIKAGRMNLGGSYAVIRGGELWLLNADVPPYQPGNTAKDYDSKRSRRLLLRKEELKNLIGKLNEKGYTLVPIRTYSKKGIVKIELGLARSKKKADKREVLKKRAVEREMQREI